MFVLSVLCSALKARDICRLVKEDGTISCKASKRAYAYTIQFVILSLRLVDCFLLFSQSVACLGKKAIS